MDEPRVAVIGDLGGHLDELRGELDRLGAHDDVLPEDLTVVQVGDLVHRGPDSEGVVALVDHFLRTQPGQWVQLIGNHEAQYVREPAFRWPERIGDDAVDTLRRWWADGSMRVAAAVRTGDESFVVSHAGVTMQFWRDVLAAPADAEATAVAINALPADDAFRAGSMLGGGAPDPLAGPMWASAADEVVPGWRDVTMPFSIVHGHSRLGDLRSHQLYIDESFLPLMTVDEQAAQITVHLDGGRIVGVDPGHGRQARRPWHAFELYGRVTA